MLNIVNKLPQALNIFIDDDFRILEPYSSLPVNKINSQIKNLEEKGFIKVCKVKSKK